MNKPTQIFTFRAIGTIRTPHRQQAGTPIQPRFAEGIRGTVEVFDSYADALVDLEGFERIWLLYVLDRAKPWAARVIPFRDTVKRGLFATRVPARPNPIGMSAVRLISIEGRILSIEGVDMLDQTPLLDIKPYVREFDAHPDSRSGWFEKGRGTVTIADDRFEDGAITSLLPK
jgi:tRNA-Thr(GGU) m(6)t(6)A37 methyltransferase TsaA